MKLTFSFSDLVKILKNPINLDGNEDEEKNREKIIDQIAFEQFSEIFEKVLEEESKANVNP